MHLIVKPRSQLVLGASTGGLRSKINENIARHASVSYDFGRTYTARKYAQWLLDMHNNQNGFLARSEYVRCTCALPKEPVR